MTESIRSYFITWKTSHYILKILFSRTEYEYLFNAPTLAAMVALANNLLEGMISDIYHSVCHLDQEPVLSILKYSDSVIHLESPISSHQ